MTKKIYGVYGTGGFGREVMSIAREQLLRQGGASNQLMFLDDNSDIDIINGQKVLRYEDFIAEESEFRYVTVAIADSKIRQRLVERLRIEGVVLWEIVSSNAVIMEDVEIGEGAILSPFTTIAANVKIGKSFQSNLYSYVAHDCILGDFVTFAPRVTCNGNVEIKNHAYIGAGAVIKQGKPNEPIIIGEGAIVGMGAVVTKSVLEGDTVVGCPATQLKKRKKK